MDSNGQIVLFIDELHTVVGTGGTTQGDGCWNLLKPMLARGTALHWGNYPDEYRKYIEKMLPGTSISAGICRTAHG